jgi:transposase
MREHCTTPRNGSKYLQVAVLDEGKVVSNSRVDNNLIKVNEFFDTLDPGNKVVMESSGMWYNIRESLRKKNLEVRLSNPAKISHQLVCQSNH